MSIVQFRKYGQWWIQKHDFESEVYKTIMLFKKVAKILIISIMYIQVATITVTWLN